MKMLKTAALAGAALLVATAAFAAPLQLKPANPQPSGLKQGLGVSYYFDSVRTLSEASRAYKKAKPGEPLAGLDYRDTAEGDETLTSGKAQKIIAVINGYVRFDAPGTYVIDFMSNDGLEMKIGGEEVVFFDGVHGCDPSEQVEAVVPEAGWYELEGLYFQRKGSACLMMRAGIGSPDWMPNSAFGYK
ncbi:PA14 domain-containing protein [uncultured Tateyamaria sp.]|uniref:PA14 domain-containing protein n=1 Tax=uncultured Tateyamaria sp. TaxID=455651 RepID=UPI002633285A|nr:PA14 domain-containing protein [uncultured Tateyamaria sp.]